MRRGIARYVGTLGLLLSGLWASRAGAETCLAGPITLPWLPGAPEWQESTGDGFWRPELHDPRWSGTPLGYLLFVPGSPAPLTAGDVAARVLDDGAGLFVSLQVLADDNGPSGDDYVYLAFSEGSGNGAYAVRVAAVDAGTTIAAPADPDGAGPTVVPQDNPLPKELAAGAITYWHTSDATLTAPDWGVEQTGKPGWLKGARWDRPVLGSPRWAITLRIDKTLANLTVGVPRIFLGASIDVVAPDDVVLGNATPKVDGDTDRIPDTIIPNRSGLWDPYVTAGAACDAGVTLAMADVGVWDGMAGTAPGVQPGTEICAGGTCGDGVNTFRAIVRNLDASAGVASWDIRARFRVAAWGSTPAFRGYGLWKDVWAPPPATPPVGEAIFTAPVGTFSDTNGWHWQLAGDTATIDYSCTKQGTDSYCPKLADESWAHQCILVEIGQPGNRQSIKNAAVYRNMDYADLSTETRHATISIAGLKKVDKKDQARDVYLYVEERNLPAPRKEPVRLATDAMAFTRQIEVSPIRFPPPVVPQGPNARTRVAARVPAKPVSEVALAAIAEAKTLIARIGQSNKVFRNGLPVRQALAMSTEQLLDTAWPTYRVRVYYDSGRTLTIGKRKSKVLIPMVPFGFRLKHSGPLYGFTHALEKAAGADLVPVGPKSPRWYKVVIPSEGAVAVKTTVTAEETPPGGSGVGSTPPCPACRTCPPPVERCRCNCRVVGAEYGMRPSIWAASALLGLAALRRRRRRSKS